MILDDQIALKGAVFPAAKKKNAREASHWLLAFDLYHCIGSIILTKKIFMSVVDNARQCGGEELSRTILRDICSDILAYPSHLDLSPAMAATDDFHVRSKLFSMITCKDACQEMRMRIFNFSPGGHLSVFSASTV